MTLMTKQEKDGGAGNTVSHHALSHVIAALGHILPQVGVSLGTPRPAETRSALHLNDRMPIAKSSATTSGSTSESGENRNRFCCRASRRRPASMIPSSAAAGSTVEVARAKSARLQGGYRDHQGLLDAGCRQRLPGHRKKGKAELMLVRGAQQVAEAARRGSRRTCRQHARPRGDGSEPQPTRTKRAARP